MVAMARMCLKLRGENIRMSGVTPYYDGADGTAFPESFALID